MIFPYVGMEAILFNSAEPFEQIVSCDRRIHVKSGKYWSNGFREYDI